MKISITNVISGMVVQKIKTGCVFIVEHVDENLVTIKSVDNILYLYYKNDIVKHFNHCLTIDELELLIEENEDD